MGKKRDRHTGRVDTLGRPVKVSEPEQAHFAPSGTASPQSDFSASDDTHHPVIDPRSCSPDEVYIGYIADQEMKWMVRAYPEDREPWLTNDFSDGYDYQVTDLRKMIVDPEGGVIRTETAEPDTPYSGEVAGVSVPWVIKAFPDSPDDQWLSPRGRHDEHVITGLREMIFDH